MDMPRSASSLHRPGRAGALVIGALLLVALAGGVGCGAVRESARAAVATPTAQPDLTTAQVSPATVVRTVPSGRRPTGTPPMGRALPDARVAEILELLLDRNADPAEIDEALDEVVRARDVRFIAPLIEVMRAGPMQMVSFGADHVRALQTLSGWTYSQSWDRWFEWYGTTDLEPPPGFATWKGRILQRLDPLYAEFFLDDLPSDVRQEQVLWAGMQADHTYPLDAPAFIEAGSEDAEYLDPEEPVFGVVVNGQARAYPLRIMDVHEIANDEIAGVPVALVYCTLTGTASLFERRAPDGQVYSFSGSGLIQDSARLMYDRETRSLWHPLRGRPILGTLVEAAEGTEGPWLGARPVVRARWGEWLERHPDTLVLSEDTGSQRRYLAGHPYLDYFASGDAMYPVAKRDTRLLTKSWVYGMEVEGIPVAYPIRAILDDHVINDRVGSVDLVLLGDWQNRPIRVNGESRMLGELRYFAGATVRAYLRPAGVTFRQGPEPGIVLDQDGEEWTLTEDALVSPSGERAPRTWGQLAYWFGWYATHPDTAIYGVSLPPSPVTSRPVVGPSDR